MAMINETLMLDPKLIFSAINYCFPHYQAAEDMKWRFNLAQHNGNS